jgi:hypothetical protein
LKQSGCCPAHWSFRLAQIRERNFFAGIVTRRGFDRFKRGEFDDSRTFHGAPAFGPHVALAEGARRSGRQRDADEEDRKPRVD